MVVEVESVSHATPRFVPAEKNLLFCRLLKFALSHVHLWAESRLKSQLVRIEHVLLSVSGKHR